MKRIIGSSLLLGSGLAFLYIFISIFITGGYMAYEPNPFILWSEIIMGAIITTFGVLLFIDVIRELKGR